MTEIEAVQALLDNMKQAKRLDELLSKVGVDGLSDDEQHWLRSEVKSKCVSEDCECNAEPRINSILEDYASYLEETAAELRAVEITREYLEEFMLSMQINALQFYREMKD